MSTVCASWDSLVCQTAEGQTAVLPRRQSGIRTDARLLAHYSFYHSTTGRICTLLLFLQLKIEGDTIKTKLGVSACMAACLIDCLPA